MADTTVRSSRELLEELAQAVVIADPGDREALPSIQERVRLLGDALARERLDSLASLLAKGTRPLADAIARGANVAGALAAAAATVSLIQNGLRPGARAPESTPAPAVTAPPTAAAASPAAASPAPAAPAAPMPAPVSADPAPSTAAEGRDAETVDLIGDFLQESTDGLAKADDILLVVEQGGHDPEQINALFRVFHTIKGVAGFLSFDDVGSLAHITETLLNLVREGTVALEGPPLDVVFDATAAMRGLLDRVRTAVETDAAVPAEPELPALIARIQAAIDGKAAPGPAAVSRPGEDLARPVAAEPAAEPAAPGAAAPSAGAKLRETLKVDVARVDQLVEMVGELIITESMVAHDPDVAALQSLRLRKHLSQLAKISRDLQDVTMRMRMVPVRGVFQKMNRFVRELSRRTGKEAVLVISGEGTEMDRSMVERIEDPLVHMIRNAIDHGVEPAEERRAAGKPVPATLRLSAFHDGGSVVIEVGDDGRGLAREKILAKAMERGLVRESQNLTDAEVHALIFAPGFSTAASVTELSGRGVGMDVVKRNVEGMRGRVGITSAAGAGTTFRMVLPLTLAIIDGMLVGVGEERYIVPSLSIVESLQPRPGMLKTLGGQDEMLDVRGEILPLYRLSRLFRVAGAREDPTQALVVVVESLGRKIGLLVDDVLAQQQVVIKPLGSVGIQEGERFSGAAILSDGRVGLILNVDRLQGAHGHAGRRSAESSEEAA
jgi:two-component system chemotaxis sensor kinase CheA